jgi:hypothetical protein
VTISALEGTSSGRSRAGGLETSGWIRASATPPPELEGRASPSGPKRRDEVAWARETDPPGDLRDREISVREQALGGLQAKVDQELVRGRSRSLLEQPPKMSGADGEDARQGRKVDAFREMLPHVL